MLQVPDQAARFSVYHVHILIKVMSVCMSVPVEIVFIFLFSIERFMATCFKCNVNQFGTIVLFIVHYPSY